MKEKMLPLRVMMNKKGKIVRIISNLYTVDVDGELYEARARGKFRLTSLSPLVGDIVVIDTKANYIMEIEKRKNELLRPSIANIDAGIIVTSCKKPDLSLSLLDKELVCVASRNVEAIIVLTKTDLLNDEELKSLNKTMNYYRSIGYQVVTNLELDKLIKLIKGKTVVLTGQTGAGKSTLLNKLDKSLNLKTSPISDALNRGVHTTRHVELFNVRGALIADTPGFSALDIELTKDELKNWFPEFQGVICKFQDCNHDAENICGVKERVREGRILKSRYDNYIKFKGELK